ncbi:MAG: type II toxin-antitoxin system HicA family toxin [Peptoniphilaceae bacterium]|nr:type II toxin-antitoxin system HicA family toxin [Peptoniphilaceae bacterium]MDY6018283.1 type II toxin-antitoxin system HicA family toxin [Anaerococcus sp.]
MKSYNSRELFKLAKKQGFRLDRVNGSHHIFVNDETGVTVAIPHPRDSYKIGTLKSILKKLGL